MDASPADIAAILSEAPASSTEGEKPILLTGPDAEMLHAALQKQLSAEPLSELHPDMLRPDFICLDPACRKGRAMELLEIAKKNAGAGTNQDNFFAGPEYLRKSDAELNA
jgi:hypothetical protein